MFFSCQANTVVFEIDKLISPLLEKDLMGPFKFIITGVRLR